MILKELSEAIGVSGKEEAVRKVILAAIDGHAENIQIDPVGSITAFKKGTGRKRPTVLLAAHMDEIGFMVTGFDSSGLIRFVNVGGIDARILPGLRVKLGDKHVPGVIVWAPIHKNRSQSVKEIEDLRIDIGVSSKDAANGKIKRGDRIAFDSQYMEIGADTLRGKAFDDRVGCSVLIDILQGGPYLVDIIAAFTAQEEVGLRGAKVVAQRTSPDIALVLESSPCHDVPNPAADPDNPVEDNPSARLGDGPVLTLLDASMVTDPRLFDFLRKTASKNDIPAQMKMRRGGGTDGGAIHVANSGTPAAVVSVPCRYIHSPTAIMRRSDYDNTLKLVQAALNDLSFKVLERKE